MGQVPREFREVTDDLSLSGSHPTVQASDPQPSKQPNLQHWLIVVKCVYYADEAERSGDL